MRTLYFDCSMGASGDMLLGALIDLLPNKEEALAELNALGIPHVTYRLETQQKCGITGSHMHVFVDGYEEDEHLLHDHNHEHEHHHHDHDDHHHHHSSLHNIEHILEHSNVPNDLKEEVISVYNLIAEAEAHVHNTTIEEIHFHEVGTMDAIADVTGVCYLMHKVNPDQVLSSPIHVGSGTVKCAHGILPVPAPATAYILKDVPIYQGNIQSELCTPTGGALLKHFVTQFIPMPVLKVQSIGYGLGTKDFPQANVLRALLATDDAANDTVLTLNFNVDDMTPEEIGYAEEQLFDNGALEVFVTPVQMKKNRPGHLITVMCREEKREEVLKTIFLHTTTNGLRETIEHRYTMRRHIETIETPYGSVRKKYADGYGTERFKYEYDDLSRIAKEQNTSMKAVIARIEQYDK